MDGRLGDRICLLRIEVNAQARVLLALHVGHFLSPPRVAKRSHILRARLAAHPVIGYKRSKVKRRDYYLPNVATCASKNQIWQTYSRHACIISLSLGASRR